MKNAYEVLRQKELDVSRLQKEVDALRIAARILAEDDGGAGAEKRPVLSSPASPPPFLNTLKPVAWKILGR